MSYRGVKRVLGETRLELKCLVLFAVCLFTLIGGSFWWYGSSIEHLVYDNAQSTGENLVAASLLQYHWSKDQDTPSEPRRNAQKAVNYWASKMQSQNYRANFIKPDPTSAEFRAKEEDAGILEQFPPSLPLEELAADDVSHKARVQFRARVVPGDNGKYYYQYYQPIYLTHSCVICHEAGDPSVTIGATGLQPPLPKREGDLLSVAKIEMDDPTQNALNQNRAIFLATAVMTVFLAMIAAYAIVRYVIVKPLKHLRDTSDEIARGNMEARAEIHTADEFEDVAVAFNKMVRHLVSTQDELKQTNAELDVKVDELAQTNLQLYEMNRLKSDFMATMSHELRTPLNSIIGFSEVLDSIKSLDDKQRRYVQNIQKSGRVLLDMINDILDLAKIESGKMEIRLSDFRIDAVVHALCDFFRPQTERKNIDLDVEIEPGLPELFQDQAKVQQVLNNLLSNAIKFTPEGGRITVNARQETETGDLLLTVSDTGVGIAEEDQLAIFEKFRQGKGVMAHGDAITREYSGTGLGLSIVRELCKLLGGDVSLHSELGRGSIFTVRLPWTLHGQAALDATVKDNLDELLRPRREEIHRVLERAGAAAPATD